MIRIFSLSAVLSLLLASCSPLSAYDIAVKNGFVGDEAAWLESLRGENGVDGIDGESGRSAYELAVENGFVGDEAAWLESLKGLGGENGKSAYEIAVENGFVGNEADWLTSLSPDFTAVAATAASSVVGVYCDITYLYHFDDGRESELDDLQVGSGILYRLDREKDEAYIITNYHILYHVDALTEDKLGDPIRVGVYGQQFEELFIPATFWGGSLEFDIAVLKVRASDLLAVGPMQAIKVAPFESLALGQEVLAFGNPEGEGLSATEGIVSMISEYIDAPALDNEFESVVRREIRFSAPINSGNSGGALLNRKGELLGVVNAKKSYFDVDDFGYAIPASIATALADRIIEDCNGKDIRTIKRCLLGITVTFDTIHNVYNEKTGTVDILEDVKIQEITETSVVKGVLEAGDIVKSFIHNGTTTTITRYFMLADLMLRARPGDELHFRVMRDGGERDIVFVVPASAAVELP